MPLNEHLRRHHAANLFLDTTPYNAAATGSLALQNGLPLLTLLGDTFAARVGASLLNAVGLPELIAADFDVYERTAVRLATHLAELLAIKSRLGVNRAVSPLFDTPRFARNLERAYRRMWSIYSTGDPPRPFEVDESEPSQGG